MNMTNELFAAFSLGLLGSGHCLGMCAGISSAVSFQRERKKSNTLPLFYYNAGRLFSYGVMGGITGALISGLVQISFLNHGLLFLRFLMALMMILLGLYMGRFWNGLAYFEKLGAPLWTKLSPLTSHLLPLKNPRFAFPLGVLWGWLPCGMVYAALTLASLAGGFSQGSLIMLAFGAGTLPAMLLVGHGASKIKLLLNNMIFRCFFSFLFLSYGIFTAYKTLIQL